MITQPSCSTLLNVIREELSSVVAPTASDATIVASLAMIDEILRVVGNRCAHEVAWMVEEIEASDRLAADIIATGDDVDGAIAAALAQLRATPTSLESTRLSARYSVSGEVLSRCLEVGMRVGGRTRSAAEEVLALRSEHEVALRGQDQTLVVRG